MTLVERHLVSLPSSDLIKMEERKRPASQDNGDIAPPHKRQATSVNGASKPHPDADMPWQDDLEVCSLSFPSISLKGSHTDLI